jgi:three-Cys-motif partner protein
MAGSKFFEEQSDQSEVKARIVQKYFFAWAKVIIPVAKKRGGKIQYIDFYSGPGRYKDGSASTPILILEKAIADPDMSQMLCSVFNDEDGNHTQSLAAEFRKISGIERLKYAPKITTGPIGGDTADILSKINLIPTFTFFDPFGYKGLSQGVIHGVLKDWGCDCVFFFNYNRINAAIDNALVEDHMAALFGAERVKNLRNLLKDMRPHQREALILEELAATLKELGGKYVLPFRFRRDQDKRTSHFLVFVSKHQLGYGIMKGIMASESSLADQGVPSFSYFPADKMTPLLFALSRPLDELEGDLLKKFSGESLSMKETFERHNVDTPYIEKNYKAALRNLEAQGKIQCVPSSSERRKIKGEVSFADHVVVKFPGP